MFIRSISLFICVGLALVSAFPAPQDDEQIIGTEDPSVAEELLVGAEFSDDGATADAGENKDDVEISTDESIPQVNSESESNTNQNDTVAESISDGEKSDDENVIPAGESESEGTDQESNDGNNKESDSENPEEAGTNEDSGNIPDDSNPKNTLSDPESGDDGDNDDEPSVISNILVNGIQMRVVTIDKGDEVQICQMVIGSDEELHDQECTTVEKSTETYVDQKVIDTGNPFGPKSFTCQSIETLTGEALQRICVGDHGWLFKGVDLHEHFLGTIIASAIIPIQ